MSGAAGLKGFTSESVAVRQDFGLSVPVTVCESHAIDSKPGTSPITSVLTRQFAAWNQERQANVAMVVLNFTLSEEGVAVLHDALACMFKFSDEVCLEARKDKVHRLITPLEAKSCV